MKSIKRPEGLYGAEGLVVSIISQAANDVIDAHSQKHIDSAKVYFAGPLYDRHLEHLGLPRGWMPAAFEIDGREST